MRKLPRGAHGQALTEMVVGLLVFVTVLLGGLYFSEVSIVALKVQEAANFALWDATARPMHDTANPGADAFTLYRQAVSAAQAEARTRYADFDGRSRINNGGGLTQFLSAATALQVTCSADPGGIAGLGPQDASNGGGANTPLAHGIPTVQGNAGLSCGAQTTVAGRDLGAFYEGRFTRDAWHDAKTLCATVTCGKAVPMLLDDWGFSGAKEGRTCPLSLDNAKPCNGAATANVGYYQVVDRTFAQDNLNVGAAPGSGRGSALAAGVAGISHIDELHFFMSFQDQRSPSGQMYSQQLPAVHMGGQAIWETTPFNLGGTRVTAYQRAWDVRQNHWLGKPQN